MDSAADSYRFLEDDSKEKDDGMTLAPSQGAENMQEQQDKNEKDTAGEDQAQEDDKDAASAESKEGQDPAADPSDPPAKRTEADDELTRTAAKLLPNAADGAAEETMHESGSEDEGEGEDTGIRIRTDDSGLPQDEPLGPEDGEAAIGAVPFDAMDAEDDDSGELLVADMVDEEERAVVRENLQQDLKHWWAGDGSVDSIWRLFDQITERPALELCEQLRLILEPTKASKMKGGELLP